MMVIVKPSYEDLEAKLHAMRAKLCAVQEQYEDKLRAVQGQLESYSRALMIAVDRLKILEEKLKKTPKTALHHHQQIKSPIPLKTKNLKNANLVKARIASHFPLKK
jgi:hypothetical protein